jgi:type III pantothenate kinase
MWGVAPHFVKASLYGLGMKNGYDLPEELGADRWIAMLASWQLSSQKRPICVIDCGTCITMDTLDQFGKHLGGLIIPGIESMRSAILTFTQGCSLQRKPSQVNQSLLAKNSYDGVMGGTVYATVACIERLLKELKDELGEAPEVFLTGGEASCIEPLLSRPVVSHPNLVIEGLSLLAKQQLKTQLEQRLRHVQEPAN